PRAITAPSSNATIRASRIGSPDPGRNLRRPALVESQPTGASHLVGRALRACRAGGHPPARTELARTPSGGRTMGASGTRKSDAEFLANQRAVGQDPPATSPLTATRPRTRPCAAPPQTPDTAA